MDDAAKQTLKSIPVFKKNAGPRDGDLWLDRLQGNFTTKTGLVCLPNQQNCFNFRRVPSFNQTDRI